MPLHSPRALLFALTATMVLGLGCNTTPSKPSLMANMAREDLTVYQLRAMDYEYASRFAQLVAASVSDIVSGTDDQRVRDRARLWRLWAMPQARSAAFDQDPLAGMLELWILARQQHQYFSSGLGEEWFGDQQPRALETTSYLRDEAERLISSVLSPNQVARMREVGNAWVESHPIEGQLYVRPTARADLASLVTPAQHGGLQAMGSMEETLRDLSDRVTILSLQTPVEVRWQAEYLVSALFEDELHEQVDAIVGSMGEISAFLARFEDTLSKQTQQVLSGVEQERMSVFTAIETERLAVLEAIQTEREAILGALDMQLTNATAELDAVGQRLIDHFFVRLIEVLVFMGIVGVLVALLVLAVVRRRGRRDD